MSVTTAPPVVARDVHVTLGSTDILHGVDLTVLPGQTVALMGPNGSGKSTLVKALVGINPLSSGTVEFFGTSAAHMRHRRQWQLVGYVPQRVTASSGVPTTALEVVRAGLLGPGRLLARRGDSARALAALERVGLAERARDSVHTFSGGQMQRVLIARALVREPQLLIMDEPMAGIDQASRYTLADTVAHMKADGVAMLIVLHETGTLDPLLDVAVTLEAGRVVSVGDAHPPAPGHEHPDHDHIHPHGDDAATSPRTPLMSETL